LPPIGKPIKLVGMITSTRLGTTKNGKAFSVFTMEDYSGKAEFFLWSNDSVRLAAFVKVGLIVFVRGSFEQKKSWGNNRELQPTGSEYKIEGMQLLDSLKGSATKALELQIQAGQITQDLINFFSDNLRANPGQCSLKIKLVDMSKQYELELGTSNRGFVMNDALVEYIMQSPEIEAKVSLF
jgi:DNA polymerase-3 subunit alpha